MWSKPWTTTLLTVPLAAVTIVSPGTKKLPASSTMTLSPSATSVGVQLVTTGVLGRNWKPSLRTAQPPCVKTATSTLPLVGVMLIRSRPAPGASTGREGTTTLSSVGDSNTTRRAGIVPNSTWELLVKSSPVMSITSPPNAEPVGSGRTIVVIVGGQTKVTFSASGRVLDVRRPSGPSFSACTSSLSPAAKWAERSGMMKTRKLSLTSLKLPPVSGMV